MLVLLIAMTPTSAAWLSGGGGTCLHRRSLTVFSLRATNSDEPTSLQGELKRAASSRLGQSLDSLVRPEDLEASTASAEKMANALREAREQLERRKAEVGEEAALKEIDPRYQQGD